MGEGGGKGRPGEIGKAVDLIKPAAADDADDGRRRCHADMLLEAAASVPRRGRSGNKELRRPAAPSRGAGGKRGRCERRNWLRLVILIVGAPVDGRGGRHFAGSPPPVPLSPWSSLPAHTLFAYNYRMCGRTRVA